MIVLFDTCALVSLANPADKFHAVADECYRQLKKGKHRLLASVISVAEFGVKDDIKSIDSWGFRVPAFEITHAAKAAQFTRLTGDKEKLPRSEEHSRKCIAADTQILAQAEVEQVDFVLTLDKKTLAKTAASLKSESLLHANVVRLDDDPLFRLGLASSPALALNQ